MKGSTLLLLALAGVVGYMLLKDQLSLTSTAPDNANPTTGATTGTNGGDNVFTSILGLVTSVFDEARKTIAQTSPTTTI